MSRSRSLVPLVPALLAALALGGCRTPRAKAGPQAAGQPPAPPPRLAEGVNTVAFVAADRSVLHSLALTRDPGALARSARAGVTALRATCAPSTPAAGTVAAFCARAAPRLDALEDAAAAGDDERMRQAARDVVEVMLADLALAPGETVDGFLRLAVARSFLERLASDRRWKDLRNAPAPALARTLVSSVETIVDVCADPARVPARWDCERALAPLEALREIAAGGIIDEQARVRARELLAALPRASAGAR
jgi:hypothetical protein